MIDQLTSYLRQKGEPASADELARHVLKLREVPTGVADQLIASICREASQVVRQVDGRWRLAESIPLIEPKLVEGAFLLLHFSPSATNWMQWLGGCAGLLSNGVYRRLAKLENVTAVYLLTALADDRNPFPCVLSGYENRASQFTLAYRQVNGRDWQRPLLTLRRMAGLAFPESAPKSLTEMAAALRLAWYEEAEPPVYLQAFAAVVSALLEQLQKQQITTLSQLWACYRPLHHIFDFSDYDFDDDLIATLPQTSGVYVMRDRQQHVLYVGKAKNLSERVASYFRTNSEEDEKLRAIRSRLYNLQIVQTGSELEALLLEERLIVEFNPLINRQIGVRVRSHRCKSRYPRIVILPSAVDGSVSLYFFHPTQELFCCRVDMATAGTPDSTLSIFARIFSADDLLGIEAEIERYFFSSIEATEEKDTKSEIAVSWLSEHEDLVESIDMRKVTTRQEAVRLLRAYLVPNRQEGKRVYY